MIIEKNVNKGREQISTSIRMLNKYPVLCIVSLMMVIGASAVPSITGEDLFEIGNGHYANASLDKAIDYWMQAKELDPTLSANAWYNIGLAYANLKEYENAIYAWNETLSAVPNSSMAYDNMGTALAILGRYEEAMAAYDMAIAIDPDVVKYQVDKQILLKTMEKKESPISPVIPIVALVILIGLFFRPGKKN